MTGNDWGTEPENPAPLPSPPRYTDARGQRVPSVTEVIKAAGYDPFAGSGISREALMRAAERGTEVHSIIASLLRIGPPYPTEHSNPYVQAWLGWAQKAQPEAALVEQPIVTKLYAGMLDYVGGSAYGTLLADWKTRDYPNAKYVRCDQLQLSGYAGLLIRSGWTTKALATRSLHLVIVELRKDGSHFPRFHRLDPPAFDRIVKLWHDRRKYNLLPNLGADDDLIDAI